MTQKAYLIVIVEVNPATKSLNSLTPLGREPHDNRPALFIIFRNTEFFDCLQAGHAEFLVDLVFDGHTVTIP